jgi:hypothetical protein
MDGSSPAHGLPVVRCPSIPVQEPSGDHTIRSPPCLGFIRSRRTTSHLPFNSSGTHDEQVVRVDTDAYDKAVKDLWRKVAGIEDAEDLPQLEISHAVIELGKIL